MMTNIILCGGSGTRLWPLSRALMPKQFVPLFNDKSLFELTFMRNAKLCSKTLIVSNEDQYFLALDQLSKHKNSPHYLLEPIPRNTAGAITLACLSLPKDEIVLITPSDHLIQDEAAYKAVVEQAFAFARENYLVTFGITPNYPETGYGYICFKDSFEVEHFCEKPTLQKAQEFINAKTYLWNSGMFAFRAGFLLEQMESYNAEIYTTCLKAYQKAIHKDNFTKIKLESMQEIPTLSIDYALMEKSNRIKVIPSDIGWSDVGSFESLAREFTPTQDSNYSNTQGEFLDSNNNFVYCNDAKKFIATIDVENLAIIDTQDALLITKKTSSQKVKQIYERIATLKHLSQSHLQTFRPWGSYTILENAKGYKIKRIEVKPGKRLSLQKHLHRNEHWIVVSGTASVEIEGKKSIVRPNESIYIKMGQEHRLANEGKIPIILIEAQVGEYTEEDDIIRISDDYDRK